MNGLEDSIIDIAIQNILQTQHNPFQNPNAIFLQK
jgi:hypothetical protein